jgi:hypothetical protein
LLLPKKPRTPPRLKRLLLKKPLLPLKKLLPNKSGADLNDKGPGGNTGAFLTFH